MTKKDDIKDLQENLQEEIEQLDLEEQENKEEEFIQEDLEEKTDEDSQIKKLKEQLARTQADYNNFKMRNERDREDMIFFLKYDIFKKILPRLDDLERIIKNTKEEDKTWPLYEWILAMEKSLKRDLESMWVKSFSSIWEELNPDKHEVMTQVPSDTPDIIIDEFEKWYMLWDRVLRVAKVIVWTSV